MRKVSKSQARKNAELAKIKKEMDRVCYFCGGYGNDLAHLLPRSIALQYHTERWNLAIFCRSHHNLFDNNVEFRKKCNSLYEQVIKNVRPEDVGLVRKYFGKE
jgi:hypothetical protein